MSLREDILEYCHTQLDAASYSDFALNGLQVEGTNSIRSIAVAVSCNRYSIEQAASIGADALLVHHGLIWGEKIGPITGPTAHRLRGLLTQQINLIAYHLPLDGHPEYGNNARLCEQLKMKQVAQFASISGTPIGIVAQPLQAQSIESIATQMSNITGQQAIVLPGGPENVRRVGIISGSGHSAVEDAVNHGCDILITGDAREPTMGLARELGITVIAAGHEATERLGVQYLGSRLRSEFGLEFATFIPDPNPV